MGDAASGFFWSILFMIASVLAIGSSVVFLIVRAVRCAEAAEAVAMPDPRLPDTAFAAAGSRD